MNRSHPFGTPEHQSPLAAELCSHHWHCVCSVPSGTGSTNPSQDTVPQQPRAAPSKTQKHHRPPLAVPCHSPCPPGSPLLYQPTVDGDPFLRPLARGSRPLQPLRASQVHKVKLGCQGLVLSSGLGSIQKAAHLLIHLQPGTQERSPPQAGAGRDSLAFTQMSARV